MLIPTRHQFYHWPFQLFLSICWFVAFGLLVNVSYIYSLSRYHGGMLTLFFLLSVDWKLLRLHLQLEQRCSLGRPVRPVQGRHCVLFPLRHILARVCNPRSVLASVPWWCWARTLLQPSQPSLCCLTSMPDVTKLPEKYEPLGLRFPTSRLRFLRF